MPFPVFPAAQNPGFHAACYYAIQQMPKRKGMLADAFDIRQTVVPVSRWSKGASPLPRLVLCYGIRDAA
jgi:hypothetical protein